MGNDSCATVMQRRVCVTLARWGRRPGKGGSGSPDLHAPRPVEGCIQVLPVHGLHQGQVLAGGFTGSIIQAGRATPSRPHCRAIDNDRCSRSTIPRRWARLMDRTSPTRNPAPPSAVRFSGTAGRSGRRRTGLLLLPVAEHAGGSRGQGFLPGLNLAGMDLVPGRQLGHRLLTLHRLQACPCEGRGPPWP